MSAEMDAGRRRHFLTNEMLYEPGVTMANGDYVTEKLCMERHGNMEKSMSEMKGRLNWLFGFVILTLGGIVVNLFLQIVGGK